MPQLLQGLPPTDLPLLQKPPDLLPSADEASSLLLHALQEETGSLEAFLQQLHPGTAPFPFRLQGGLLLRALPRGKALFQVPSLPESLQALSPLFLQKPPEVLPQQEGSTPFLLQRPETATCLLQDRLRLLQGPQGLFPARGGLSLRLLLVLKRRLQGGDPSLHLSHPGLPLFDLGLQFQSPMAGGVLSPGDRPGRLEHVPLQGGHGAPEGTARHGLAVPVGAHHQQIPHEVLQGRTPLVLDLHQVQGKPHRPGSGGRAGAVGVAGTGAFQGQKRPPSRLVSLEEVDAAPRLLQGLHQHPELPPPQEGLHRLGAFGRAAERIQHHHGVGIQLPQAGRRDHVLHRPGKHLQLQHLGPFLRLGAQGGGLPAKPLNLRRAFLAARVGFRVTGRGGLHPGQSPFPALCRPIPLCPHLLQEVAQALQILAPFQPSLPQGGQVRPGAGFLRLQGTPTPQKLFPDLPVRSGPAPDLFVPRLQLLPLGQDLLPLPLQGGADLSVGLRLRGLAAVLLLQRSLLPAKLLFPPGALRQGGAQGIDPPPLLLEETAQGFPLAGFLLPGGGGLIPLPLQVGGLEAPGPSPEAPAFPQSPQQLEGGGTLLQGLLQVSPPNPVVAPAQLLQPIQQLPGSGRPDHLRGDLLPPRRQLRGEGPKALVFLLSPGEAVRRVGASLPVHVDAEEGLQLETAGGRTLLDHLRHLALPDEGEPVPLQVELALRLLQLLEGPALPVHQGLGGAVRQDPAAQGADPQILPKLEGHLRLLRSGQAGGSLKEQVALPGNAQPPRVAVPQGPAEGIQQVALAAAVGPHHRHEAGAQGQIVAPPEALKPSEMQPRDVQPPVPPAAPADPPDAPSGPGSPGSPGGTGPRKTPAPPEGRGSARTPPARP